MDIYVSPIIGCALEKHWQRSRVLQGIPRVLQRYFKARIQWKGNDDSMPGRDGWLRRNVGRVKTLGKRCVGSFKPASPLQVLVAGMEWVEYDGWKWYGWYHEDVHQSMKV